MDQDQKKAITVKEAALTKYSDDGFEVHNFHHISFSPKRKGTVSFLSCDTLSCFQLY